jgi:hypothetical protein
MDIRRSALLACAATVLGLAMPLWNGAERMAAAQSAHPQWWAIPTGTIALLFTAIMPVFYFALYHDGADLRFSRRLRQLALLAALVLIAGTALDLHQWFANQGYADSVLVSERVPWKISDIGWFFGVLSNVSCILLMIAVYRHKDNQSETTACLPKFLTITTKTAVIAWGIFVALCIFRLGAGPFTYPELRRITLQYGQSPPSLLSIMEKPARMLLSAAALFVGPYIVWRAIPSTTVEINSNGEVSDPTPGPVSDQQPIGE